MAAEPLLRQRGRVGEGSSDKALKISQLIKENVFPLEFNTERLMDLVFLSSFTSCLSLSPCWIGNLGTSSVIAFGMSIHLGLDPLVLAAEPLPGQSMTPGDLSQLRNTEFSCSPVLPISSDKKPNPAAQTPLGTVHQN